MSLNIKFKIKSEDETEFLLGFLVSMPKPSTPSYTDEEWVEKCTQVFLVNHYRQGKIITAQSGADIQDIGIEEI